MLVAGVGSSLAIELGLAPPRLWGDEPPSLDLGRFAPLVETMVSTPLEELQPVLVAALSRGVTGSDLIAAGALANARAFGGEDYEGYHVMMALMPAYEMSQQLPDREKALPLLKVLYRNTARLDRAGKRSARTLAPVTPANTSVERALAELRGFARAGDREKAERAFARVVADAPDRAYEALQPLVHDDIEVHRVVLAWRAFDVLRLTGAEHAEALLRQTVRFCVNDEKPRRAGEIRRLLPELLEKYSTLETGLGTKHGDDVWLGELARVIFTASRSEAARAVAAALAQGYDPIAVGEALSIASTRLTLHDPGRTSAATYGRDKGSVHGASVGVHASDSAQAWRAIAAVSSPRNAAASLIVGAYHTAGQGQRLGGALPYREHVHDDDAKVSPKTLFQRLDGAIRDRDQLRACAVASALTRHEGAVSPLFDRLLQYAVSEDGALHAEKYFRTVQSAVASGRDAFREEHLLALTRVTASEYGTPAPGRDQARELLRG